jgi:glycosyltransferase involved in cell wall biosynthesis
MKLVFIVDHDIEKTNGVSFQSKQFIKWLAERNHEVFVMFPSNNNNHNQNYGQNVRCYPIPAFSVPSYPEYSVPLPPLAAKLWLKKWQADLVHAETINPTLLLLGYWIKYRSKAPMFNVLTANIPYYSHILFPKDNMIKKSCLKIGKTLMNWISNRIDGTFVLSRGVRKPLTQDFLNIDPNRVYSLRRPIDLQRFGNNSGGKKSEDHFNVPRGKRLFTLSRLCDTKNVDFLIRTFAKHIYPKNRELHFFVGGYGPLENQLKTLASELRCPNIHFLGKIDVDEVPTLLCSSDYFLYGSTSETYGNIVCEAKYSKVPVIALDDKAGVNSQIVNNRTGILVENHKEEEFAAKFFKLYHNPLLCETIRQNAHSDVLINNNPQKIYTDLLNVYHKFKDKDEMAEEELKSLFS